MTSITKPIINSPPYVHDMLHGWNDPINATKRSLSAAEKAASCAAACARGGALLSGPSLSPQASRCARLCAPRLVCWGVSNQGRQAADGMTMPNWHGVVGTRKQTAAIFILLVSPSSLFLMNKAAAEKKWNSNLAAAGRLKERKERRRRRRRRALEISLFLILHLLWVWEDRTARRFLRNRELLYTLKKKTLFKDKPRMRLSLSYILY